MRGLTPKDPADEAMIARAHERFAADRKRPRKAGAEGALPNLIVIGGLKCGTTSLHHYLNLHPEVGMSRPKELNFFVEDMNWGLGVDWYRSHFPANATVRGETSPHYTNRPRSEGVAARMRETLGSDARLIYMVRHPIDRLLSHYLHNVGGGYESRELADALSQPSSSYIQRGLYALQLEPYLEAFGRERILVVSREELGRERDATVRKRLRLRRRRRELHLARVRPRMGNRQRQGQGRLPRHGPRRTHARPARARSQLRPPAGADALDGRAARPRPGVGRGRRSRSSIPSYGRVSLPPSARTPRGSSTWSSGRWAGSSR